MNETKPSRTTASAASTPEKQSEPASASRPEKKDPALLISTVLYILSAVAFLSYFLTSTTFSLVIGALLMIAGAIFSHRARS